MKRKRGNIVEYKYETHMHTSEGSACGASSGAEQVEAYYNAGYAGIIITDHFSTVIVQWTETFHGKKESSFFAGDMRMQKREAMSWE